MLMGGFVRLVTLWFCVPTGLWKMVRNGWRWRKMGGCGRWPLMVMSNCCNWNTSEDGRMVYWCSLTSARTWAWNWWEHIARKQCSINALVWRVFAQNQDGGFSMHFVHWFKNVLIFWLRVVVLFQWFGPHYCDLHGQPPTHTDTTFCMHCTSEMIPKVPHLLGLQKHQPNLLQSCWSRNKYTTK